MVVRVDREKSDGRCKKLEKPFSSFPRWKEDELQQILSLGGEKGVS